MFILMTVSTKVGIKSFIKLTPKERFSAYWYVINGAIIHIMMDGAVGGFDCFQPLAYLYRHMDTRFVERDDLTILVTWVEFFFMGPACLYLARLYVSTRSMKREIFSIIVSVF